MIRRGISGTQSSVPSPLTSVLRPGVAPIPVAVAARRTQPVVRALLLLRWRFSQVPDSSTPNLSSRKVLLPIKANLGSYSLARFE
jgi:hypothetical protein